MKRKKEKIFLIDKTSKEKKDITDIYNYLYVVKNNDVMVYYKREGFRYTTTHSNSYIEII